MQDPGRAHTKIGPLLLSVLLLSGCAGSRIDRTPFETFHETTEELQNSTYLTLDAQMAAARARFLDLLATSDDDSLQDAMVQKLLLEPSEDDPFGWTSPGGTPLFLAATRFQESVGALNIALVQYADLLRTLVDAGTLTPDDFNAAAHQINDRLAQASVGLGTTPSAERIAIFSIAATSLFQAHLAASTRTSLQQALLANQGAMQSLADHLQGAVWLAAKLVHHEYQEQSFALAQSMPKATSNAGRAQLANALVGLNDSYLAQLKSLRVLARAYGLLPAANQGLAASLDNPNLALTTLTQIGDEAKQLQSLYEELTQSSASPGDEESHEEETDEQ